MFSRIFAAAIVAGFVVFLPARADAACCDQATGSCCDKAKPCCDKKQHAHEPSALDFLVSLEPAAPAAPARQTAEVWFMRPTWIGKSIVQGRYVIEHDNDRMARGEPCTHVYAYDDRTKPVATFHCTHIERDEADTNLVRLIDDPSGFKRLTEFQFAGEHASHGHPAVR